MAAQLGAPPVPLADGLSWIISPHTWAQRLTHGRTLEAGKCDASFVHSPFPAIRGLPNGPLRVQNSPSWQRSYGGQGIFCNPTLWLPIVDVGVMSRAGATTLLLGSEWQRQAVTTVSSPFLVLDED